MSDFYKPSLDLLEPSWTLAGVKAAFSVRSGGVSSGSYGDASGIMGMNVATHTGDFGACVTMNRNILTQCVPSTPKWLTQTHSTTVVCADDVNEPVEADASFSMTPGVVCTVMVADCLPILVAEKSGRIVGAIHAGWRSLAHGIIEETLAKMDQALGEKGQYRAWLGPRIDADSFEVGPEVLLEFEKNIKEAKSAFTQKDEAHYGADLAKLASMVLTQKGLQEGDIEDCARSTYLEKDFFYSFRRDGEKSGRHAAMIWIEPASKEGQK